jgi:RimJ/RimL family protein N-acetyltransferase
MVQNASPTVYRVETERLVLRCWQPGDVDGLCDAIGASLDELREWMPWAHDEPKPPDEKIEFIREARSAFDDDRDYIFGIFDAAEETVLGGTGLHTRRGPGIREIGYWVRSSHTGRGIATEATAALTQIAFETQGVHRVEIRCSPDNEASAAIPEKLGFEHEGTLKKAGVDAEGNPRDTMIWGMPDSNFSGSPPDAAAIEGFDVRGRCVLSNARR